MKREIIGNELERLERANADLANGQTMDLYSLREGIVLYGISMEGDEYIRGPLFISPGDAILNALNPAYWRDSMGFATKDFPANTPSSKKFHFESMIRLREYRFDARALFYDSRGKVRPICMDVGAGNFKVYFYLRLPLGNDSTLSPQPISGVQGQDVDLILTNILSGKTAFFTGRLDAFFFCQPGRSLTIDRSYRIDMAILWTFYAGLLAKGYSPIRIREEAFLSEKSAGVFAQILQDRQTPSTLGDIPEKITKSIDSGSNLESLAKTCAATPLGQKICVSGVFFQRLWNRDLKSVYQAYPGPKVATDETRLYPDLFTGQPKNKTALKKNFDPYQATWFFKEDFMPEMGRDVLAYNWNYNRFLDINTTIYWILLNLSRPPTKEMNRSNSLPFLVATPSYDPKKHLSLIPHRLTDLALTSVTRITLYDAAKDLALSLSFDPKTETNALTASRGLYIYLTSIHRAVSAENRGDVIEKQLLQFIRDLNAKLGNLLTISPAAKGATGKSDPEILVVECAPSDQTIDGVSTNWLILPFVSSLLRYMVRTWDFDFFVFG